MRDTCTGSRALTAAQCLAPFAAGNVHQRHLSVVPAACSPDGRQSCRLRANYGQCVAQQLLLQQQQ